MANEFVARKGLISKASSIISGSLTVTQPITGSGAGLTNIPSSGLQAPGSDTQILFNSDGSLAANSGLVYSGSKVGIGIASPGWQLEVKGGIVTQDDNTTASMLIRQVDEHVAEFVISPSDDSPSNYFQFRPNSQGADAGLRVYDRYETDYVFLRHDGGNGYIGTKSSGQAGNLNIQTAGITAMTIQSGSNNVGIGTANPISDLFVNSSNNVGFILQHASRPTLALTDGTNYSYIGLESGGAIITGTTDNDLSIRSPRNIVFGGNSIARMTIENAGNVGIGTASPGAKLDVVGTIRSINSAANPAFNLSDNVNSNWDIELESATNSFKIDQNSGGFNTTALYITGSNGYVGIGTTSPSAKLHVSGTSDVLLIEGSGSTIFDVQGSQGQLFSVTDSLVGSLFSVNDISGLPIIEVFDTDKVVMGTFGQNTLVVSGSNVAIGTGSFDRRFTVAENTTYLSIGEKAGFTPSNYGPILETNSGAMVMPNRTYWSNSNVWIDKNGTAARFHGDGGILFSYYNGGVNEAMRITNSGNVGIGTTNPVARLEVRDGNILVSGSNSKVAVGTATGIPRIYSNANEDLFLATANQSGSVVYLQDSNGYVGIGTSSPTKKLTVSGAVSASTYFGDASNLSNVTTTDGLADILENNNSAGPYSLDMNGNDVIGVDELAVGLVNGISASLSYVTSSGDLFIDTNVGIGTASPAYKLDVVGGIQATLPLRLTSSNPGIIFKETDVTDKNWDIQVNGGDLKFYEVDDSRSTFTQHVTFKNGGNVGIGTTTPSEKLEVRGNIEVTGSSYHFISDHGSMSGGVGVLLRSEGSNLPFVQWASDGKIHAGMRATSGGHFAITTNKYNNRIFIQSGSGNVGIGTTSPSQKLTVQGNISASGDLYLGNNSTINFNTTTGTVGKIVGGSDLSFYSDNLIKFVESDANIIRLVAGTNSGTFNINTTGEYNSAIKLYVNGDSRINGDLTVTGIVTAQEFHTEFVSASIIFQSGSTQFGNSADDTHISSGSNIIRVNQTTAAFTNPGLKIRPLSTTNDTGLTSINLGTSPLDNFGVSLSGWRYQNDGDPKFTIKMHNNSATGTDALTIDSSGNVGIGTTNPVGLLTVQGDDADIYLRSNDYTIARIINRGSSGTNLDTGLFSLMSSDGTNNNVEKVRLDAGGNSWLNGGNVGIGTTSPGAELHVYDPTLWAQIIVEAANDGYDSSVVYTQAGVTKGITGYDDSTDTVALKYGTFSGNGIDVTSAGNVGIGTTSPSRLLHIKGNTNPSILIEAVDTSSPAMTAHMVIQGYDGRGKGIVLTESGSYADREIFFGSTYAGANANFSIGYRNDGTGQAEYKDNSKFYINLESGAVGIGTTSISQKLEVRDGNLMVSSSTSEVVIGTASGKPRMQSNNNKDLLFSTPSYTNLVYLQESTGMVGIGTTSPNKKLTVEGAVSASGGFYGSGANLTGITTSDGLADILDNNNSAGGFNLDMNNNDIQGVGEIQADVFNGLSASLSYVTSSAGVFVDSRMGIGTQPNPTAALQVEGIISGSKIDLKRGGYITFYGDDDGTGDHSISGRDANGNPSDDLRINSFHNVYVNLDSNNNNTSTSTSFSISQHGGTGTLGSAVFSVRGDGLTTVTGDLTVTGNTYATASWATDLVNIPDLVAVLTAGNGGGGLSITEVNDITATGTVEAGSFVETSARRFKENIEPIEGALDIVSNIDGVTFNRIGEERREHGFIADDILDVAPELVSYDDTGQVHGVHYARMVAVLTEAVKELNDKVKAQDLFIKDLVARIEKLENK